MTMIKSKRFYHKTWISSVCFHILGRICVYYVLLTALVSGDGYRSLISNSKFFFFFQYNWVNIVDQCKSEHILLPLCCNTVNIPLYKIKCTKSMTQSDSRNTNLLNHHRWHANIFSQKHQVHQIWITCH